MSLIAHEDNDPSSEARIGTDKDNDEMAPGQVYPKKKENRMNRHRENGLSKRGLS